MLAYDLSRKAEKRCPSAPSLLCPSWTYSGPDTWQVFAVAKSLKTTLGERAPGTSPMRLAQQPLHSIREVYPIKMNKRRSLCWPRKIITDLHGQNYIGEFGVSRAHRTPACSARFAMQACNMLGFDSPERLSGEGGLSRMGARRERLALAIEWPLNEPALPLGAAEPAPGHPGDCCPGFARPLAPRLEFAAA
jgi:hypothetical protein